MSSRGEYEVAKARNTLVLPASPSLQPQDRQAYDIHYSDGYELHHVNSTISVDSATDHVISSFVSHRRPESSTPPKPSSQLFIPIRPTLSITIGGAAVTNM